MSSGIEEELIFGRYQVIRRLAVGGMGEIFLARQSEMSGIDRLAILKVLLPEFQDSDESIDAFMDEARVAATLNHPNIVTLFEVGLWQDTHIIAMEYIRGESVAGLLSQEANFPVHVAAHIIRDAALGLDHAHFARNIHGEPLGIVHRDISPQNIMVREDGVGKVVDFGIAKAQGRATRTATGNIKGKLTYMSPEQLTGKSLDARSDQFSLGVMFWEMCAKKRLFKGDSQLEIFENILRRPIPRLSELVEDIPPEIDECVARMLNRDPAERYPRCEEVAVVLGKYLTEQDFNATREVSRFVKMVAGKKINDVTGDLTPQAFRRNSLGVTKQIARLDKEESHSRGSKLKRYALLGILALLIGLGVLQRETMVNWVAPPAKNDIGPANHHIKTTSKNDAFAILEPTGAQVFVDDKLWPEPVPTEISGLEPGDHQIRLVLKGKRVQRSRVKVKPKPRPEEKPLPAIVDLVSVPPGARIEVNGELRGKTPLTLSDLTPGTPYSIRLSLKGYLHKKVTLSDLKPGQNRARTFALEKRRELKVRKPEKKKSDTEPTNEIGFGWVSINTKPWTQVTINGKQHGSTPLARVKIPSGQHKVRLFNKTLGIDHRETLHVKPGKTSKIIRKFPTQQP